MNHRMLIAVLGALILLTLGCSDSEISYPVGEGGWEIGLDLGEIPPRIYDVPVTISIQADVINLTDGDRPTDGSVLIFTTSGGSFVNGLTEIEFGTIDGRVITELEIQLPGTYDLEVEFPQGSCTVSAVFSIGLE
jgi:hypothetical protein